MDRDNKENAANAADYDMEKPVDWDGFRDNEVDYSSKEFNALESLQNIQKPEVIGKLTFCSFIIFIALFTAIVVLQRDVSRAYGFETIMTQAFVADGKAELETLDDFYTWAKDVWFARMFSPSGNSIDPADRHYLNEYNKLVSRPMMYITRRDVGECTTGYRIDDKDFYQRCVDQLFFDKDAFGPASNETKYQSVEDKFLAYYPVFFEVDRENAADSTMDAAIAKLDELQLDKFLDLHTTGIHVKFVMYNGNIDLFCVVHVQWDIKIDGRIILQPDIIAFKLLPYSTFRDKARFILEVVFLVAFAAILFFELREIISKGFHNQYCNFHGEAIWNYYDLISVSLLVAAVVTWFLFLAARPTPAESDSILFEDPQESFTLTLSWLQTYYTLNTLEFLVFCIRIFAYFRHMDAMSMVARTIGKSSKDLAYFAIQFMTVMVIYAVMGHYFFGTRLRDFDGFASSMSTVMSMATGNFGYEQVKIRTDVQYGLESFIPAIYYWSFFIAVTLILINMFLVIVMDVYSSVRELRELPRAKKLFKRDLEEYLQIEVRDRHAFQNFKHTMAYVMRYTFTGRIFSDAQYDAITVPKVTTLRKMMDKSKFAHSKYPSALLVEKSDEDGKLKDTELVSQA